MKLFNDLFTGPTNDNYELWRVMSAISFLIGMGLVVYTVAWRGQDFDLEQFAWGVGVLLFGASGGTALKDFVASKARKGAV
tara:strand:+ start:214 stop:456 length:243 start_codon:yes stop_codon:yes gene_type:complete